MGADVICLHNQPDGDRINVNCGSTHLDILADAVKEYGAHIGFAFDGDADRVLVIQLQTGQDEDLGLRPELTASIARTVVTRMEMANYPSDYITTANVFRRNWENDISSSKNINQAGVEKGFASYIVVKTRCTVTDRLPFETKSFS